MQGIKTAALLALLTVGLFAQGRQKQDSRPQSNSSTGSQIFIVRPGGAFEGQLVKQSKTSLLIKTALGPRRILKTALVEQSDASDLRRRYEQRVQNRAHRSSKDGLRLALWCERVGLTSGLADELDKALRRSPNDPKAWAMIKRLAPAYRPAARNSTPPTKNRWSRKEVDLLVAGIKKATRPQAAVLCERLRGLPSDILTNPLLKIAAKGSPQERLVASRLLGDLKTTRRVKPLYRRALGDPSWSVREAAVQSLKRRDDGTTIGPFLKVLLGAPQTRHRLYAAEALGQLGDRRAVPALLRALRAVGDNPKARNNITITTQTAYIKDFDVEVAQGAVIADPVVGLAQEGVVLDVAVVSITIQRRTFGTALGRLTGQTFGADHRKWSAWWKANKSTFS